MNRLPLKRRGSRWGRNWWPGPAFPRQDSPWEPHSRSRRVPQPHVEAVLELLPGTYPNPCCCLRHPCTFVAQRPPGFLPPEFPASGSPIAQDTYIPPPDPLCSPPNPRAPACTSIADYLETVLRTCVNRVAQPQNPSAQNSCTQRRRSKLRPHNSSAPQSRRATALLACRSDREH